MAEKSSQPSEWAKNLNSKTKMKYEGKPKRKKWRRGIKDNQTIASVKARKPWQGAHKRERGSNI